MFIDLKADYLDVVLNLNVDHDDDNVHNAKSFHHIEGFRSEKKTMDEQNGLFRDMKSYRF